MCDRLPPGGGPIVTYCLFQAMWLMTASLFQTVWWRPGQRRSSHVGVAGQQEYSFHLCLFFLFTRVYQTAPCLESLGLKNPTISFRWAVQSVCTYIHTCNYSMI